MKDTHTHKPIHDSSTVQHRRHEDIVSGAVDERYVSSKLPVSLVEVGEGVFLRGAERAEPTHRIDSLVRVGAFINLGIRIPKLDGDISHELVLESNGLDA